MNMEVAEVERVAEELASPTMKEEDEDEENDFHFDRFGFVATDSFHQAVNIPMNVLYARKETEIERTKKWIQMMKKWDRFSKSKLKTRIRKGIPDVARGFCWNRLAVSSAFKTQYPSIAELDEREIDPNVLDEIDRDVNRTFPRHILFRQEGGLGQSLLRVNLSRLAKIDPELGYCQGMGFILGMLLTFMPEEDAFYTFLAVLKDPKYNLREMYLTGMIGIKRNLFIFERLGEMYLGKLWQHLIKEGLHPTMFATEWFMTLYTRGFSFDLAARVWEIFLNEGIKIVFRVALAILKNIEKDLLEGSFEEIMALMRNISTTVDGEQIIHLAFSIPLKRKDISDLTTEFNESQKKN